MSDTITLPREVVKLALEALGEETAWFGPTPKGAAAITALRTALAAEPKQEPVAKAWAEGYQQGVKDERTSEASIGIAGFGAKVEPARQNPYGTAIAAEQPKPEPVASDDDEEFTREDVTTLLLEVMDWTYAKANRNRPMTEAEQKVLNDIRTALAAEPTKPKPEPVAWLSRDEARLALWKSINSRKFGNPTDDKLILDHLRQQGLWIGKVTSPAPPDAPTVKESLTHPGYVIGNHWFETAYERLCAGEAEDAILEDYEVVREPRLRDLRRDAERYRWLREKDGIAVDVTVFGSMEANLDAAIDAAMEASTAPASAAADASTAPEAKP